MNDSQIETGAGADLTVISNVYNEASRIPGMLKMLEEQSIPDLRVVFVDDGSTDGTCEAIAAYEGPLDVHLIALDHVGLAPARTRGLSAVDRGVAVVIDADMEFDPGWLEAMRELFVGDSGIGGSFSRVSDSGDTWVARGGQSVREVLYWLKGRSARPWMVGHGMAIRVEAYRSLGFTSDDYTAEDLEISEQLTGAGWRIVPLDGPRIRTQDPATLEGVWRRHVTVGRRTAHLLRRHPGFLLRASNAGRFFPPILIGAWLIDRRLVVAGEIAMSGALLWMMRRGGVEGRDLAPGWVVFHVQTVASFVGLVLEVGKMLPVTRGRSAM